MGESPLESRIRHAVATLEGAWDRAFDFDGDDLGAQPLERAMGTFVAECCAGLEVAVDPAVDAALRAGEFHPAPRNGQVKPRLDNGTVASVFIEAFARFPDAERDWAAALLFDAVLARYAATLAALHDASRPWLMPGHVDRKDELPFDAVKAWSTERVEATGRYVPSHIDRQAIAAKVRRSFLPETEFKELHATIDGDDQRLLRFRSLAAQPGAFAVVGAERRPLPFALMDVPAAYTAVGPGARTFRYRIESGAPRFRLAPEVAARRRPQLKRLAASMRDKGAVFDNGQALAALHRVRRTPDELVLELGRLSYYEYMMANVMAPLDGHAIAEPLDASMEEIWGVPRGAFPGLSALVITQDRYVVLQVRDHRPAADQMTINTSISGGMDLADAAEPNPLEAGLLREGRNEISRILRRAVERGARITYLGWLRNLHRAYLPELSWVVELTETPAAAWLASDNDCAPGEESWRSSAKLRSEAFEAEDGKRPGRGQLWLPGLLFIKESVLLANAARVLDLDAFPVSTRPTGAPGSLALGWLTTPPPRGRLWRGVATADVHTTLDCDDRFKAHRAEALAMLARRQPALPLLSTLAMYVTMLQRTGQHDRLPPALTPQV